MRAAAASRLPRCSATSAVDPGVCAAAAHVNPAVPTTGYDDVKRVALARLFVDNVPSIQVDWSLYGPKLAQVALTVGADDVDAVSAVDDMTEGRRRAPLEEIRRNIRAAGSEPVERNGRFDRIASMTPVRLGAVGYLNARPLVFGLERSPRFDLRFDVPSDARELLHAGDDRRRADPVDRIPARRRRTAIVPDLAIASRGPVASVALFTTRPMSDVRSIALDTSSRTSVALVRVLCARLFGIAAGDRVARPGSRRRCSRAATRR